MFVDIPGRISLNLLRDPRKYISIAIGTTSVTTLKLDNPSINALRLALFHIAGLVLIN